MIVPFPAVPLYDTRLLPSHRRLFKYISPLSLSQSVILWNRGGSSGQIHSVWSIQKGPRLPIKLCGLELLTIVAIVLHQRSSSLSLIIVITIIMMTRLVSLSQVLFSFSCVRVTCSSLLSLFSLSLSRLAKMIKVNDSRKRQWFPTRYLPAYSHKNFFRGLNCYQQKSGTGRGEC